MTINSTYKTVQIYLYRFSFYSIVFVFLGQPLYTVSTNNTGGSRILTGGRGWGGDGGGRGVGEGGSKFLSEFRFNETAIFTLIV